METAVLRKPSTWQPKELVDVGNDCQCGITIDDGCFVVLGKNWQGSWRPITHFPSSVARRLGELAARDN